MTQGRMGNGRLFVRGVWSLLVWGSLSGMAHAASEARDLVTVDKGFDLKSRVQAWGGQAALAEHDGRMLIKLTYPPGNNTYPGVFFPAPGGKWDLSACSRVEFQLSNAGASEVRLGCRVSDDYAADGHKHCNTEMITLKPGEGKTVTVTFGRSYGNFGWKLNAANVVGVLVLAEHPTAEAAVLLQGIRAIEGDVPGQTRLAPDATWQPVAHALVPDKGSALDFSFLLEGPAGKHGPVVIRNGRMEFAAKPGQPARFYGANVVYGANFPDKETAEIMADQLARNGYNSLRFHHFDQLILDKKANDSLTFDPAQVDRIDYFFACLKARGIYVTIDLYATRETKPDEIPELGKKTVMESYKSAVYILDSARKNWESFASRLLSHVNPYTQLAWKDDPALFALSLVNEGQVYQTWQANAALYKQRFEAVNKSAAASQTEDEKAAAWNHFLTDLQAKWIREETAFVRGLGCKALITDANYIPMRPLSIFRTQLEVVDIHCYWDGPQALSGWGAPLRCNQGNLVRDGGVHMPLYSVAGRLFDKPFMITEFNVGYPNKFRSTCGPMVGAFSALQGIDAVYRFDHIGAVQNKPGAIVWFSSANDPIALMGDRVGSALFLRQEIKPAETVAPYLVTDEYLNKPKALDWSHWYPDSYIALGMKHRIGTVVLRKGEKLAFPSKVFVSTETVSQEQVGDATVFSPNEPGKVEDMIRRTQPLDGTGQQDPIRVDRGKGTFRMVTDLSESLFMPDASAPLLEGRVLRAENHVGQALVSLVSIDGKPLSGSRRMLLMHLTDIRNGGELYRDAALSFLEKYGSKGLLAQKGEVRITLKGAWSGAKLYALDLSGKRVSPVALEKTADGMAFTAQTFRPEGVCLAYEVVR